MDDNLSIENQIEHEDKLMGKSGLASNVLKSDTSVYSSDQGSVFCLDFETGKERWIKPLPFKKNGMAKLYEDEKNLFLINIGLAEEIEESEINYITYNKPYISVLDKKTGEQKFIHEFSDLKRYLYQVNVDKHNIYICTDEKMYIFNKKNFTLISNEMGKDKSPMNKFFPLYTFDKNINVYPYNQGVDIAEVLCGKQTLINLTNNTTISPNDFLLFPVENGLLIIDKTTNDLDILSFSNLGLLEYEDAKMKVILPCLKSMEWETSNFAKKLLFVAKTGNNMVNTYELTSWDFRFLNNSLIFMKNNIFKIYKLDNM